MNARDSAFDRPTAGQCAQARAAGVGAWFGYLATIQTPGAFNLASPWDLASFQVVRAAGLQVGAFCSGLDDPWRLAQLAGAWGVTRVLLDVEDGIRGDGSWVDGWLQASGFGLYGGTEVQYHAANYRMVAIYPLDGCIGQDWPASPPPQEPHGWQCQGTHQEFGLSCDTSVLSPGFFALEAPPQAPRLAVVPDDGVPRP